MVEIQLSDFFWKNLMHKGENTFVALQLKNDSNLVNFTHLDKYLKMPINLVERVKNHICVLLIY